LISSVEGENSLRPEGLAPHSGPILMEKDLIKKAKKNHHLLDHFILKK